MGLNRSGFLEGKGGKGEKRVRKKNLVEMKVEQKWSEIEQK